MAKRPMRSAFAAGATLVAVPAFAQVPAPAAAQTPAAPESAEQEGRLADIVVTAQRRSENLQDVPIAVTAIDATTLEAKGIDSTTDLGSVTPGLTYTTVVGSALPRIRGIGTAISLGGNENPVATYVDGVYIASAAASVLSFNNIEQIAVLKGPQGTLFGRNATGGLIQVTTRDPRANPEMQASLTYGNLDTIGGNLYVTGGLTGGLSADLAVYYNDQRDGFGRNLTTGSEVNKARDFAVRSKWKLELGPDTTVRLAGDYSDGRAVAPAFRPLYDSLPISGVPFTGGEFDIENDIDPQVTREQGGISLNVAHDFGGVDLVSITAWRKGNFRAIFDIDKLPVFISRSDLSETQRQFSQEVQLLSSASSPFRWVLGAYYFSSTGAYAPLVIDNVPNDIIIRSEQKTASVAVFGQASYDLTDRTGLTLGLRYTSENKDYVATGRVVLASGTVVNNPTVTGELDASKLTWRAAIDHRIDDNVLIYLSYNRGFKSGGFNPQRFQLPTAPFEPEVLDAVEVGVKTDLLERRVRLNGAAFYYDYKNIQINSFQAGISTIYNAASAKLYGLDLDATAIASRNLSFTLGLSLLHHRYGDFPGAVISTPAVPNGTIIRGGNMITTGNAQGNRLSLTPDWTVNVGVDYVIPLSSGEIRLSANYFHSDGWRAEADNRIGQGPYDLVNAAATWKVGDDGRYSVKLWGKNLGDVAYAVQMNAQPQSDGIAVGPGRSYGVTLGVAF